MKTSHSDAILECLLSKVKIGCVGVVVDAWQVEGVCREGGFDRIQGHLLEGPVQGHTRDIGDAGLWTHVCGDRV